MTSQWYKAGPRATWQGRVEVIGNHTRVYYSQWPDQSRDMKRINVHEVQYNVRTGWWEPIDTDLEVDIGL